MRKLARALKTKGRSKLAPSQALGVHALCARLLLIPGILKQVWGRPNPQHPDQLLSKTGALAILD